MTFKSNGQDRISVTNNIYHLSYKTEIPITAAMFGLTVYGFHLLSEKPTLDIIQIHALDMNDVWAFDRHVFSQPHPAPSHVYTISDIGLWTSYVLPALLFIDKEIRDSWLDITIMYLETQSVNLNVYVWGGPVFTHRVRPLVYFEEESMEYKLGKGTTDSFFSGHVSMTAGASFFIAKVLNDYHPEWGSKKWLVYGAALIPPAFVGYYRYRGFMHFPTDLILGLAVGTTVGIVVPQFHKLSRRRAKNISIIPFTGRITGVSFAMEF